MQRSGNVAIFWDYENCPAPNSTSGYAIANSISTLARSFGSVKVFKAYQEIFDQSRLSLRSELHSSGVSLVDCPHNGRKDVADKMILVDMLSYAIDNPAPSTILLITSDRDFAYALSILKNRLYKVVLVKRPDTHVSLILQACICFDWFDDVVHQAENPSSQAEQSPHRLYQRHRKCSELDPIRDSPSSRPSPCHCAAEGPIGSGAGTEETLDIIPFLRDRISDRVRPGLPEHPQLGTATEDSPRQDQGIAISPKRRRGPSFSTSQKSPSNSALVLEKQQTSLKAPKLQSTQPKTPCIVLPLPNDDPSAIRDVPSVEPLFSTPASHSVNNDIAHSTKTTGTLLEPTKDVLSSISALSSPLLTTPIKIVAQPIVHHETKPTQSPTTPPISAEQLAEKLLKNEPTDTISSIGPSTAKFAISPRFPKSPTSQSPKPTDAKPAIPSISGDSGPDQSTGLPDDPVPPTFVILVEALRLQRSRGVYLSLRSLVSARISEKGETYKKAGVSSFRQYALLAEQAGIVDLGGLGGNAWIRLRPRWYGVPIDPVK